MLCQKNYVQKFQRRREKEELRFRHVASNQSLCRLFLFRRFSLLKIKVLARIGYDLSVPPQRFK
jgi:hypothetical protein